MDWLQFTAEVIKAAAWPVALSVVAFWFRDDIGALLKRTKSLEGPAALKALFSDGLARADLDVPQAVSKETAQAVEEKPIYSEHHPDNPAYVVMVAWRKLDDALGAAVMAHGLKYNYERRVQGMTMSMKHAEMLLDAGLISPRQYSAIENLQGLRLQVAGYKYEPEEEDARHYELIASRITESIQEIARKGNHTGFGDAQ